MKDVGNYLAYWRDRYRDDLTEHILPFWLKYGLDRKHGGIYTCLDREGKLMDTTKSVWFQGRFAFIASFAYNQIERRPEWLEAARLTIEFIERHCFDSDGRMYFEVTEEGLPLRKRRYVFSETFAAIAFSEYALATGDKAYAAKALGLFRDIQYFLSTPGFLPAKYTEHLKAEGHSIVMILINTASRIREAIQDPLLDEQIERSIRTLETHFIHPEYKALLEMVGPNGEFIDTLQGRLINPGHCIETAWFLLEEAKSRGGDKHLVELGCKILDWSWAWGWDEQYGGIINFRDCKGFPSQDYAQDMKFWWPQTEAIIATLYAYQMTGEERYLQLHQRISDWTYAHFPDPTYGEWYGYLHRDGTVAQPAKGNLFKLCQELLRTE